MADEQNNYYSNPQNGTDPVPQGGGSGDTWNGAPVNPGDPNAGYTSNAGYDPNAGYQADHSTAGQAPYQTGYYGGYTPYSSPYEANLEEPIGLGSFVGMQILNAIPVLGLIMDIVWGATGHTKSRKNFGWSALIVRLVAAAIVVGLGSLLMAGLVALFSNAVEHRTDGDFPTSLDELESYLSGEAGYPSSDGYEAGTDEYEAGTDEGFNEWDVEEEWDSYEEDAFDPTIPAVTDGTRSYDASTGTLVFDINGQEVTSPLSYGDFSALDIRMSGVDNYDDTDHQMWVYHIDPNGADVDVAVEAESLDVNAETNVTSVTMYFYYTPSSCMGLTCNSGHDEVVALIEELGGTIDSDDYNEESGFGSVEASLNFDFTLSFWLDEGHLRSLVVRQPVG